MSLTVSSSSKLQSLLDIIPIAEGHYQGIKPLSKPSPHSRGVYGGNLCGQAILAAMQTVDNDFVPHSLHSYFIAAGDDSKVCDYKVERVSTGRNFANRLVRVYQDDKLRYMVMISLTKRNSIRKTQEQFEAGKGPAPFEYQIPPGEAFGGSNLDELPVYGRDPNHLIEHKLTKEFININEKEELVKTPGERKLSFFIRIHDVPLETKFRYAAMGLVTDSLYLTSVSRILHLPRENDKPLGTSGGKNNHFFSVSLDHSIYFHDDDFDPTAWMYFHYQSPRFSNNRVLFTGGYYNRKGKLVASIVQEGLLFFKDGAEMKAKM